MSRKKNIEEFIDLDRLQEVMDYDPETGWLTWRVGNHGRKPGKRAGSLKKNGYRRITIDNVSFPASHVAWYHFYGVAPEGDVLDYKNLDKDDNRIENLREATYSENSRNIGRRSSNTTGLKGAARFNSPRNLKKYRASIRVDGRRIHLGQFSTPEEAHEAYSKKVAEFHGAFGRVK